MRTHYDSAAPLPDTCPEGTSKLCPGYVYRNVQAAMFTRAQHCKQSNDCHNRMEFKCGGLFMQWRA